MNVIKAINILALKDSGKSTSEIAEILGVCKHRANEIIRRSHQRIELDKSGAPPLSSRAINGLKMHFGKWPTREEVSNIPDFEFLKTKNLGQKTLKEIRSWAPFEE